MGVEYLNEDRIERDNVILIGVICEDGMWYVVMLEIGWGCRKVMGIEMIEEIGY
ncbi:hypothetical protein [Staphylococcus auricularis]|uniref:hypothetical protein n=1 Tax=Staphylococcus auricularis TaxID=29379 RepID=UPI00177ECC8C|nr:hypothetical protein [Staphylococcus auricularis]